jgi:hypothetical protein
MRLSLTLLEPEITFLALKVLLKIFAGFFLQMEAFNFQ